MKILYAGAGEHLDILDHFPDCKDFILIDSQPLSSYGYSNPELSNYNPNFINNISNNLYSRGYKLDRIIKLNERLIPNNLNIKNGENFISTKYIFKTHDTTVSYYISTCLPNHIYSSILQNDLRECDTLLISGHYPPSQVLNYIRKPFRFIGYSGTWYPSLEERNKLPTEYDAIREIGTGNRQISEYILVNHTSGNKQTYTTYEEFYNAANK